MTQPRMRASAVLVLLAIGASCGDDDSAAPATLEARTGPPATLVADSAAEDDDVTSIGVTTPVNTSASSSTEPPGSSAGEAIGPSAVEVAMGFLAAYGAYDADRALSYLADEAIDDPRPVEYGRTAEEFRLELALLEAIRYRHTITGCEDVGESPAGIAIRCAFDVHAFGSDEVGLGPYTDNYWDLTVRDGTLTAAMSSWAFATNGFSSERWEPFADWVRRNYADEVLALYTDEEQVQFVNGEEAVALLDQRVTEFVAEETAAPGD